MIGNQDHQFAQNNQPVRRNSIPHLGINHTDDMTSSLLPEKVIRDSLLYDPNYVNAWMNLNIGFADRFKGIKDSFKNKNLNFFEHLRGKKWQNVKKICPKINYRAFLNNHKEVYTMFVNQWRMINHKYLIREVERMPTKPCSFCHKEFKVKDDISLLPCLDIVHFKCLKGKFKGFAFFKQKEQLCV
jgi:hypothetical protein